MLDNFPFYLGILIVILLLIMLANKIKVAYPILLVLAGLAISFIPGVPAIKIEPELIFFIFLPPLLYEAAWTVSWKEMWRWRRIITSFAFVVVFVSALSVALVANYFIPGFSLALGFVLGGIVSPPDAVSAGAILKFVKVPKTISSILEGESLLNDASSLIIFRFAMIAVATEQFIFYKAAVSFSWMIFGGVAIGLFIGWLFMKAHKYLPTDANVDIVLSLITPYIIYLAAEEVHSSGVLAVVSGGLLLSNNRHRFLSSKSRLQGINVWESFCFILNGFVFMLIGLDLPEITKGLEAVSITTAIGYGVLITFVLIVSRILSSYGAVIVTLIARNFITVADRRNPGYKTPFILGWTGMRGVVSLAAALSIPVYLNNGNGFPQRNLILFITFIVILLTLVIQGLTLPYFIRKIKLTDVYDSPLPRDEAYNLLRKELAEYALEYLKTNYNDHIENNTSLQQLIQKWEQLSNEIDDDSISKDLKEIYLDLLNQQRQWLINKNRDDKTLDESVIRRQMHYLDIEEEKLRYI
ncbi:sodium/proton antiporter (CPA1 family) [Flavobacterium araucananum]|jgi:Na+/H+ antiporter|uniref:Na+/H+ antiporter n=1 Tax=Flavobacterium araucananum TaxID=946678 RepID=A0A227P4P7_9FLAO|nr:Na+/H+ antiporter [Flavobacterium araucananum]OXG04156.1 Na+/H+ antiporter [Flavobacterium araucananum]PWK01264.1 sodium/proton antiporter (CPA1 family) [Flavobacterium araucananum]